VIKVFVVDSHEVVRRGIANLLRNKPDLDLIGEAGTAMEAVSLVPSLRPDVMVIEARLPDGDGVDLYRALRTGSPELKCLLFTGTTDQQVIYKAILDGIDGIVSKASPGVDIVAALRQVAAGQVALSPALTRQLMDRLRGSPVEDERLAVLSPRERTIVDHIARGKTNREIAEDLNLAEKTVKNCVSRLLLKMGFSRRTEIAVYMARLPERQDAEMPAHWRSTG
jgi:two-component system, NarL family, response regulator DevR